MMTKQPLFFLNFRTNIKYSKQVAKNNNTVNFISTKSLKRSIIQYYEQKRSNRFEKFNDLLKLV